MEYCLITSREKIQEKDFIFWGGRDKLGPKLGFLPFSQVCTIIFS